MEQCQTQPLKPPLYSKHDALGAKFADFAGFLMPLYYAAGAIEEHLAVREKAGLFDVSHMGVIEVRGEEALAFLNFLFASELAGKSDGQITYGVFCNEQGGAVDDALIYQLSQECFWIVVNAANRDKDWKHLQRYSSDFSVALKHFYEEKGILALQGPASKQILERLFPQLDLAYLHFETRVFEGEEMMLARCGYTGELGYELIASHAVIERLWTKLLELGKDQGLLPVGLAARDSLRLEKGYALYGHELNDERSPQESVASWSLAKNKASFLGKEATEKKRVGKKVAALLLEPKTGIAREGYRVFKDGQEVGLITSGGYSPSLKTSIALAVTEALEKGETVSIEIRNKQVPAQVVKLPFVSS